MAKATENIPLPEDTINAVRTLLLQQGELGCDVSEFIDQVLRREVFHQTVAQIKQQNASVGSATLQQEINEAVDWASEHRP